MTDSPQDGAGRGGGVLLAVADHLAARLFWWLLGAAVVGIVATGVAEALADRTGVILAVMVLGLGFGVGLQDLRHGLARPRLLAAVLAGQLLATPALGWALTAADGPVAVGAAIQAAAPAEITAPLLVALAGGTLAAALPVMALTVLLAPLTMPPLLAATAGAEVAVDAPGLLVSLLLTVALPMLVGSSVPTVRGGSDRLARLGRGLSAAMVVVLVLAVAGSAAGRLGDRGPGALAAAAGMAGLLVVGGFAVGAVAGRATRLPAADRHVVVFSVGMREFGVATAVALGFFGTEAALVPAVYGPVMMLTAAWIAGRLR